MGYRLLALDLDGTLLRADHTVDPRDVAAINALQATGVTVTIATGRLWTGAIDAARACAIEGVIACCEGSHLVELATERTVVHHGLEDDTAKLVRDTLEAHGLISFVFDARGIHHDDAGALYAPYVRTWSPNLRVVDAAGAWQTVPLAVCAVGDSAAVAAAHAVLLQHADRLFSVSFSVNMVPGKHAMLVRVAGPNKGTALRELCRLAGCDVSEAVVVGDWLNDVPMFQVAGRSFCMATAPEAVRAAASDTLVTAAGAGGGIAEAIQRAFG